MEKTGKKTKNIPFFLYLLPVFFGGLFCVWYIHAAASDVVYSDYIRLIDAYLPDVADPAKFLVPDVFTRIPAAFLERFLNVRLFGFSVTADRLLTVCGLLLCGTVLADYAGRMQIGPGYWLLLMTVLFSLIKWEILLNGSGWAHVVSFGLFFWNYALLERYYTGERGKSLRLRLFLAPFLILMFAGEYIAAYAAVMLLSYLFCIMRAQGAAWERNTSLTADGGKTESCRKPAARFSDGESRTLSAAFFCTFFALLIYLLSRSFAVWEHSGATELSFLEVLAGNPGFLPRFFVKSFAGAVLGQETIAALTEQGLMSDTTVLLFGAAVIGGYLLAIVLYIKTGLYKKTLFPMILLLSGGMNHVLVTLSRWIFLKESYALSSRYAAQFMIGLLGIMLIFALCKKESALFGTPRKSRICKGILIAFCIFFSAGNCYTTYDEIKKAKYREENFEEMERMLRDYKSYPVEALCRRLEWTKDPEVLLRAAGILEENGWNVFRQRGEGELQ